MPVEWSGGAPSGESGTRPQDAGPQSAPRSRGDDEGDGGSGLAVRMMLNLERTEDMAMRQKSILVTVLISAALMLGALTPASAAASPGGGQPEANEAANDKKPKDKAKDKDTDTCNDFRHPCKATPSTAVLPTSSSSSSVAMPKWFYLVNKVAD